jgi:hypothetical protein
VAERWNRTRDRVLFDHFMRLSFIAHYLERTIKLSVLPALCILERPWNADIRLDSLTLDPRTVPTLVGRNREDELISAAPPTLIPVRDISRPGVFMPSIVASEFSFANSVTISAAPVVCSLTRVTMCP